VWNVLKNNLGKSLSRITLPLVFNEPLSFLQRCVEDLEYSHILDTAAKFPDSAVSPLLCYFPVNHRPPNCPHLSRSASLLLVSFR